MSFINFFHDDPGLENLADFIARNELNISPEELLGYEDNGDNMLEAYLPTDGNTPLSSVLRAPVTLKVPVEAIPRDLRPIQSTIVDNTNFRAFWGERINAVIESDGYIPVRAEVEANVGRVFRVNEDATVLVYMRSLGKLVNISAFVNSVSISVSKNGGDFNIDLDDYDFSNLESFLFNRKKNFVGKKNISTLTSRNNERVWRRNVGFLHINIQPQDLVFIKYERLELENNSFFKDFKYESIEDLFESGLVIANCSWDLIGLVDANVVSTTPENTSISVTGRDLNKLLSNDGVYFYPLDFIDRAGDYVNNDLTFVRGDENNSLNRLITGELNFFNAYVDRSVSYSIRFIFSLLSNIKVIPNDELFSSYSPDDITFKYEFFTPVTKAEENPDYSTRVQQRITSNNSIDNEQRKSNLQQQRAEGIWQIIKLVIDGEVGERRIVDSSITLAQGNLLSFVNKVAQSPFVEFWGDTYGNNFYFLTRKPPFTKEAFKNNFTIKVEEFQVYQDQLGFYEEDIFSWYRLIPRGNYFGDDNVALADFPAIFFKEYADIWGNKPLEVVSNYIDYNGWVGSALGDKVSYLEEQALQDLSFIIESNAYNPFVRKGNIVIKGDRRIKVGMNIEYVPTGEIFHVTGVKQNLTNNLGGIDRATVLQVERGMVKSHIDRYFEIIELQKNNNGKTLNYRFSVNEENFQFFLTKQQFS